MHKDRGPSSQVVVSGRMREPRKAQVRDVLLSVSKAFGSDAPGSKTFRYTFSPTTMSNRILFQLIAVIRTLFIIFLYIEAVFPMYNATFDK